MKGKIRTDSGEQTDTGHDFPGNPDKNETRTGHGHCCPPTSGQSWTLLKDESLTSAQIINFGTLLFHGAEVNISIELVAEVHGLVPKLLVPNFDCPKVNGSGIKNQRPKEPESTVKKTQCERS